MKQIIRNLLDLFGLIYIPENHVVDNPFEQGQPRTFKQTPQEKEKDNVVHHHGKKWTREEREDGWTETVTTASTLDRQTQVTDTDKRTIKNKGLSITKAGILKPHWAAGLTAKETTGMFVGQRGYKERTVEKYWALFNTALKEQLETV